MSEFKAIISDPSIDDTLALGKAFKDLPENEKEAIADHMAPYAESFAGVVASEGKLTPSTVEVTCMYFQADSSRTNLLNPHEACVEGEEIADGEVEYKAPSLLESTERTWNWLLGGESRRLKSKGDLILSVFLGCRAFRRLQMAEKEKAVWSSR